ncbi:MAG: rRNA pseudouridine synthase [Desulfobacterales bacterium]|nr:rRNA pseudouridine synthase [Desulfobacterales bacterium]
MRLHKFFSHSGICSRRKAEEHIRLGRVRVNGEIITTMGVMVDPQVDRVEFCGKRLQLTTHHVYIAVNKPKGYISTCNSNDNNIILELVDVPARVYPIGRLDKDSTGILLLTNDGSIHHRLSHPSFDHEKEYEVALAEPIADDVLSRLSQGLVIDGKRTRPAQVRRLAKNMFNIILQEGRNRQIHRMVEKVGNQVTHLKRIRFANILLGNLQEGCWRYLTPFEIKGLINGTCSPKKMHTAKKF